MDELVKSKGTIEVALADLHYQYIPVLTSEKIWHNDMSLPNSPHVEFARLMIDMANGSGFSWDRVKESRYYQDRIYRMKIGVGSKKNVKAKIMSRYLVFKNIRNMGFKETESSKAPIIVLDEPFWKTRFNLELPWLQGMEIWDGGGRCALAYAMGMETIKVRSYKDAQPGRCKSEKFKKKLLKVKGLF